MTYPTKEEMTKAWAIIFKPLLKHEQASSQEREFMLDVMRRENRANADAFLSIIKGEEKSEQ